MPPLRLSPATRRLALQVASGAACGCFAFGLLTQEQQRQQQPVQLLEKEDEEGGEDGSGSGSVPPQQQVPPSPPPATSTSTGTGSRANWIRRQFTTRRQSINSEEHDIEWTPEGGGSGVQQRRAAVRRGTTAIDEGQQHQQQQDGTKKKAWKKSLEEAAAAGGKGGGVEHGEGGERGDGSEGGATTAARMLKQLQAWETRPPGPCDKYNALTSRFLAWQTRRKECNAAPDCLFVGRSVTGWCIPEVEASLYEMPYDDKATAEEDDEANQEQDSNSSSNGDYYYYDKDDDDDDDGSSEFPSPDDPEGPMVETELLQSLVTIIREEGIEQPVRLLITGRLADAMADSLKDGQTGSKELAKALVMEVLTDPESPHALKHILAQPGLRASIRQSLHGLCYLPYTKQEAHRLLKQQLDWLLVKNRVTEESLAWTFHQLLLSKKTHEALVPLLTWTLSEGGPVVEPLTKLTSQTLVPMLEEVTTYGLKVGAQYALESEYVRNLAKDGVKDVLLRVARVAAQKREEQEEKRRKALRERGGGGGEETGGEGSGEKEKKEEENDYVAAPAVVEEDGEESNEKDEAEA